MMYEAMPKSTIQVSSPSSFLIPSSLFLVTSHWQPLFLLILPQHHAKVFISCYPIELFLRGRIHQIIDGI